jgi:hypothetical protein
MSQTKTTNSSQSTQFNPQSMSQFNSLQPQIGSLLSQYMQNPLKSGMFNLRLQNATKAVNQMGQQGASNIMQNTVAGGFGGGNMAAFKNAMLAQNSRATSANLSNAFSQNLLGQQQLQQNAMMGAMNYKPLATGQSGTQTQTVSGLGSWLPQLAGAAIGAFAGGMGGLPAAPTGGSMFSAGNPMLPSMMSSINNPSPNVFGSFGLPPGLG